MNINETQEEVTTTLALKRCLGCQQELPLDQFYRNSGQPGGYKSRCKPCYLAQSKEAWKVWYPSSAGKVSSQQRQSRRRAAKLGLPYEPYDPFDIYNRDGGTCSLCGEPCEKYKPNGHRAFHIEHVVPLQVDKTLLPSFGITEHPGDVSYNVTIAHDTCNSSKGNRMTQDDADNYFRLRDLYKEQP